MSIPPLLFDTYKQYKVGTSNLVSWLGSTAKKTGLVDDMFPRPVLSDAKGKGRLKGKARSAAAQCDASRIFHFRATDFSRLAEAITATTPDNIPSSVLQTLAEVIKARKQCAGWFASQQTQDANSFKIANEQHQHFIQILEDVRRILAPTSKSAGKPDSPHQAPVSASRNGVEKLANLFAYLEVEDPAESTTEPQPSKAVKPSKTKETYEIEPSDEDISFAIFCLFKDLTEIRHYVRITWAEYRERQIALTTAAVTMNTAIAMFRRLNEDFISNFPQFDDHRMIINFLYDGYCDPNGEAGDHVAYETTSFRVPSKIVFCDHTCEVVHRFFMGPAELPFYQANSGLKLTKDEETLMKCLSIFGLVAQECEGEFNQDQLIQGLHLAKTSKKLATWVVLAVQLFVDTRRVVGGQGLDRCVGDFHSMQEWLSATVKECEDFGVENGVNHWYKVNDGLLQETSKHLEVIAQQDFIQGLLDHYFGARAKTYSWGPFFLFRNHPMLCGLLMQTFLTEVHEMAIGLCGDQAAMLATIHLYNAAHQSSIMPKSTEWIDFERLIDWQGSSYIFLGDRPKEPAMCSRHLGLVQGVSAVTVGLDRNRKQTVKFPKGRVPMSKKGCRHLRLVPLYAELRNAQAGKNPGTRRWMPTRARDDPLVMLEMIVLKRLEKQQESPSQVSTPTTNKFRSNNTQPKLAPVGMISILKECFQGEEKIFRFDLLRLNERYVKLLRKVQKVCVDESPLDYPNSEWGHDRHVSGVVNHMLAGVAGVARRQPTRFLEACLLLKEVVEAEGDEEWKQSEARCFVLGVKKQVTDDFETPPEDVILIQERQKFGPMIFDDGKGNIRIL